MSFTTISRFLLGGLLAQGLLAQTDYDRISSRCRELVEKEKAAGAEPMCHLVIESQPHDWSAHVLLGSALALTKNNSDATTEFNRDCCRLMMRRNTAKP
jgi:hypothetical protein